jgi:predicted DNA-binding transcriptional regulator YafY
MPDSTLRQITLLQLVPRRSPGATTAELQRRLDDQGHSISRRTIQRDLIRLSAHFPLVTEGEDVPRWCWMEGSDGLTAPAHDAYSALTWTLIEEHLEPLLPFAARKEAQPQFAAARKYLKQTPRNRIDRWHQRVRVIPRAFELQTPDVPEAVLEPVYAALFEGRQLRVDYRSRGREKARSMRVHPLGLILREGVIYLLGTIDDYTDLRQLVAHRIEAATVLDQPANEPEDFDLDEYIASGGFSYVETGPIELVLQVEEYAAEHLIESPIAPEQSVRALNDGRKEIRARVVDTKQLRWWLAGFGDAVEVVEPLHLRQALVEQARAVVELYRS